MKPFLNLGITALVGASHVVDIKGRKSRLFFLTAGHLRFPGFLTFAAGL
jgi:hypothetical protein